MKPSVGVIVGRFQVHELHDKHMELIQTVRGLHSRVVVFVGVAPTLATKRNPLDFITRKRMIQAAFPDVTVAPLPDLSTNEAWSKSLDSRVRELVQYGDVTLYGGRDSFIPSYSGQFKPVELQLQPLKISGEELRVQVSNTVMGSPDFRAGVIYSTQNRWPLTIPCVDVAIMDIKRTEVLLARKPDEVKWRFVGGHVDPNDDNLEQAALREMFEETGLDPAQYPVYVGSSKINDWRYGKEEDKITSSLFLVTVSNQAAIAKDDIEEVRWFKVGDITPFDIVPAHGPLWLQFKKFLRMEEKNA